MKRKKVFVSLFQTCRKMISPVLFGGSMPRFVILAFSLFLLSQYSNTNTQYFGIGTPYHKNDSMCVCDDRKAWQECESECEEGMLLMQYMHKNHQTLHNSGLA